MKQSYLIYPLVFGFAAAYLISGLTIYKIRPVLHQSITKIESAKTINNDKMKIAAIILKNVFGVNVGAPEKEKISAKKTNTVNSESLNGYNLVGFVLGKSPMALFKKKGESLVIVDKKNPFNDKWYLAGIADSVVYLKNKINGRIKKFTIESSEAGSGMIGFANQNTRSISYDGITHIMLQRSLIKKKMTNFNMFLKNVQINPYFKGTKTVGYRLSYISKASILNKIGLRRGDIIVSVNGKPTSDTLKMMNLYSQLSNMTGVNLDILRNGIRKTIFVEVE